MSTSTDGGIMAALQDNSDTRELRLGLVMTGGVSLAVWMGGVSAEIFRCIKQTGLYGDLSRLTETRVIVDVMSGSSAGGLNGAFLGTAIAYGLDVAEFDELRDLWLEVGSFSQLLRDPLAKDPPSLLQGDEFFTVKINEIISRWLARKGGIAYPDGQDDLTLILTTSVLSAELEQFTDDFDTAILEPNHRATFTFEGQHFADKPTLAARLALAARTTASFPGAFEASYIPIGESIPGKPTKPGSRPDMDGIASFDRSHWAVDGGVLVNKPVGPALDAILKRASNSEVRRVVAYVNPDPGSPQQTVDVEAAAPTIGEVVLKSVVSMPRAESIADHLEELREINQRTNDKRDLRDSLLRGVRVGPAGTPRQQIDIENVAGQMYPYWIKLRSTQAVDSRLEKHFVRARIDQTHAVSAGAGRAPVTFRDLRLALEQTRGEQSWLAPQLPSPAGLAAADATWRWGFQPLGYIADFALDLIHRSFALLPLGPDNDLVRWQLGVLRERVHLERGFLRTLRQADEDYWADSLATLPAEYPELLDCAPKLAEQLYSRWPVPPRNVLLAPGPSTAEQRRLDIWNAFVELVVDGDDRAARVTAARAHTPPDASPAAEPAMAARHDTARVALARTESNSVVGGAAVVSAAADRGAAPSSIGERLHHLPTSPAAMAEDLRERARQVEMRIAWELTTIVRDMGTHMATAIAVNRMWVGAPADASQSVDDDPCAIRVTDPAVALKQIGVKLGIVSEGAAVFAAPPTDDHTQLAPLLRLLLSVYVVHSCSGPDLAGAPRLELIQVSAFGKNRVVTDRSLPDQKVAGLQVGHFGGFLKRSWRANDWMWGAMDGAERIVAMLLEPARLRQRFRDTSEAIDALRPILTGCGLLAAELTDDEQMFLDAAWARVEPAIRADLDLLFVAPGRPLPRRLDALCAHSTYVAQLMIAKEQLPVVARAVVTSALEGGAESLEAVEFVESVRFVLEPDSKGNQAAIPRRRLLINDVGALLTKCKVGMEKATDELSSDLGAATTAKAAAVGGTALSGTRGGLGPLSLPAKALRTGALGVYFTTAAALRKTRVGVAVTFLLLAIGAGAISARLLGADVPSPVLVASIALLGVWLVYTGASAKAWWTSAVGALVLGVVALSFIDPGKACNTFADAASCPPPIFDEPGWKGALPSIVVVVFGIGALLSLIQGIRYLLDRGIQTQLEQLGAPVMAGKPLRNKAFKAFGITVLFAAIAFVYEQWVHPTLFTGSPSDSTTWNESVLVLGVLAAAAALVVANAFVGPASPKRLTWQRLVGVGVLALAAVMVMLVHDGATITLRRSDVIRWISTLGDNRAMVTLVAIPAVFIALEFARTQYQIVRTRVDHRTALLRLRKAREMRAAVSPKP